MARIVGGIGTSHIPAIGLAMARNQFEEPYWKPFFEAYRPVRAWLDGAADGGGGHLQRSRAQLLSRQDAGVRGGRGAHVPER